MSQYITPEQYEIAKNNGISYHTLHYRVYRSNWRPERACTELPQKQRKGLWYKWGHLATHHGITRRQFYDRVSRKNGMSCYDAATKPIKKGK